MIGWGINNNRKTNKVKEKIINTFEKNKKNFNEKKEKTGKEDDIIGIIEIPKINVKAPIKEGTDSKIIDYSIGHFKGTALPGQKGNFALAGHRNYDTGEYFLNINKLSNGDEIKIETYNDNYVYIVTNSIIVKAEDIEILNSAEDREITLVTCTSDGKDRLIVKGVLKK